jgi:hypothetical protein
VSTLLALSLQPPDNPQGYCGSYIDPTQPILNESTCADTPFMVCSGNGLEFCGGPSVLQVWQNTQYAGKIPTGPPIPDVSSLQLPSTGSALYQGCYAEADGFRALNGSSFTNTLSMTVELCGTFCQNGHYSLFGLEYYYVRTARPASFAMSNQTSNVTAQLIPLQRQKLAKGIVLTTVWETVPSFVARPALSASGASITQTTSLQARLLQPDQQPLQQALEPHCHPPRS